MRELADCDHPVLRPFYARGEAFSVTHITNQGELRSRFGWTFEFSLLLQRFEIVNDAVNFNANAALGI
jgi:hypothetical protein